jgi:hypothetical protein
VGQPCAIKCEFGRDIKWFFSLLCHFSVPKIVFVPSSVKGGPQGYRCRMVRTNNHSLSKSGIKPQCTQPGQFSHSLSRRSQVIFAFGENGTPPGPLACRLRPGRILKARPRTQLKKSAGALQ